MTKSSLITPVVLPLATDVDSPSLTYSVSALPAGLSFDAATRTVSGTLTANAGTYPITYTVSDGTLTATQTFNIVVNSPANTAPSIVSAPSATYSVAKNNSSAANLTVDDTESGAASVSVTATSSNQSIVKNANVVVSAGAGGARTITVTPESGATGTVTVNYVLNDGTTTTNGSYTVTFTNSAPVISAAVSNQSYTQGVGITNLVLPAATDSDSGETVTYTTSALPAGLSFDAATRTISGTPTAGAGTYPITYTATD